jgi:hypothetical protein
MITQIYALVGTVTLLVDDLFDSFPPQPMVFSQIPHDSSCQAICGCGCGYGKNGDMKYCRRCDQQTSVESGESVGVLYMSNITQVVIIRVIICLV